MKSYKVLKPIKHNDVDYNPGDVIQDEIGSVATLIDDEVLIPLGLANAIASEAVEKERQRVAEEAKKATEEKKD